MGGTVFSRMIHHKQLRIAVALVGVLCGAVACNLFIVPQGLYTGGLYGVCQIVRTLLTEKLGLTASFDLAGVLYFIANIPLLFLAWRSLGRKFVLRLVVCTACSSALLSVIPVPAVPIIADPLSSCLVGGILAGFGGGLVLTCGCSTGGLDVLGLYLSKKGSGFTVGKFSITFNAFLYVACALLFSLNTAIYSAIYTVFCSLFLDRFHQQNVTTQVLIFTKDKSAEISEFIMDKMERGVTSWKGVGGYTHEGLTVLCACLNKYEVASVQQMVREIDSNAFVIVNKDVTTGGNFERHLL